MNHYIIYMHPSKDSFNGAILNELMCSLIEKKHDVKVNHLYSKPFDSHLTWNEYKESLNNRYVDDSLAEQKMIQWADRIIFIFPVWWGGFPSIGKGYIDRILSYGFAYELQGESPIPLMKNKKVSLVFTTGAPEEEFIQSGMYDHMVELMDKSIFEFCGFKLDGVLHFGDVIQKSDEERHQMLRSVKDFCDEFH
jgi:NAD(P)H dehydrogenase (quinone)